MSLPITLVCMADRHDICKGCACACHDGGEPWIPSPEEVETVNKAHAGVYALMGVTIWRMEALVKLADDFEETERRTRMKVIDADGNVIGEVVDVRFDA